jgi:ABC-type transport system substrate-binding protein
LNNLKKGNIDSANIEISSYSEKSFKKDNLLSLATPDYFAAFLNTSNKALSNKEIRQALSYLVDKQEITDKILNGHGAALNSLLLPSFYGLSEPDNPLSYDEVKGFQLLEKNGYTLKDGVRKKTIEKSSGFKFSQTLQVGSNNTDVKKLQECLASDPEIYRKELSLELSAKAPRQRLLNSRKNTRMIF